MKHSTLEASFGVSALLSLSICLAGCGGGGSSPSPSPASPQCPPAPARTLSQSSTAEWIPCSSSSKNCCNPRASVAEYCPGSLKCQACGSSNSCECPAAPTTPAPTSPIGPSPAPSATRLKIVNGCASRPLWIAHTAAGGTAGPDLQDVKISSGASMPFQTSTDGKGLVSTRFWPKMGCVCDEIGSNCSIGDSGGPKETCVVHAAAGDDYSNCAPPLDTKFEATFATADPSRDTVDMSLVDGYTLPFKLEASGGSCVRNGLAFSEMDCSGLSLSQCPKAEMLNGQTVDLRAFHPKTGEVSGCYSPCLRLTDDKWNTKPSAADSPAAAPYCCAGASGTPEVCNAGPIVQTDYVKMIHTSCPAGYGYAYDDKRATIVCSPSTEYVVTFYCPTEVVGVEELVL